MSDSLQPGKSGALPEAAGRVAAEPSGDYVARSRARYLQKRRRKVWARAGGLTALLIWLCAASWFPLSPFIWVAAWLLYLVWKKAVRDLKLLGRSAGPAAELAAAPPIIGAEPPRALSPEEQAIHDALRQSSATLERCYRYWQWSLVGGGIAAAVGVFALTPWMGESGFLAVPIGVCCGAAAMRWFRVKGDRAAIDAVNRIATAGPEMTGVVIDFLLASDERLQGTAQTALCGLLYRFRASDGPSLKPVHRRYLYSQLRVGTLSYRPQIAAAVLHLMEQLADPDGEPYLQEFLSSLDPNNPYNRPLLNAAYLALQSIGAAGATMGKRGTLLSPADAPKAADGSLLRPSFGTSVQPPDQLLRSAQSASED